jgi:hypothetical protein
MRLRHVLLRDGELLDAVLLDIGFACRRSENALPCGNSHRPFYKVICPTGKKTFVRENLSSRHSENISLRDCPKSHLHFPHPGPQEGRIAIVTDVGQGMRWTLQRQAQSLRGRMMLRRTAKSCGPGAPMQALRS